MELIANICHLLLNGRLSFGWSSVADVIIPPFSSSLFVLVYFSFSLERTTLLKIQKKIVSLKNSLIPRNAVIGSKWSFPLSSAFSSFQPAWSSVANRLQASKVPSQWKLHLAWGIKKHLVSGIKMTQDLRREREDPYLENKDPEETFLIAKKQ